jgi:hypothetical protein
MRDIETIDSELGLLLAIRHMAREAEGRTPNTARIDALLDERSATMVLSTTVAGAAWHRRPRSSVQPTVSETVRADVGSVAGS